MQNISAPSKAFTAQGAYPETSTPLQRLGKVESTECKACTDNYKSLECEFL